VIHRGITVSEQLEAYAQLEPYWSGARERAGLVEGLSRYEGKSSIYHSVNWEASDAAELRKDNRERAAKGLPSVRGHDRAPRAKNGVNDPKILELLKKGCSYNGISRSLGVSISVARRVGRQHGIDRSVFASKRGISG
jgi:hypothetical protein